ncbi:MAG: Gfo/Idh/MocA family oxidoreductase [Bacteroidales bacterium]|nr:Gfo/Idh/MocA family oxidoreductase [Bacteroidales bacterium]
MDRRSFLGKMGGLGAAGIALSALPIVEACSPDKKAAVVGGKVRLGLIGPGSRGQLHLANLQQIVNAEVVALCDIYQPNLEKGLEMFPNAKSYTDYRALLEDKDVDGVIIATPLNEHYHMAMDAMSAGKHVLCEKAMAYTMDECLDMYRTAQSCGKVFIIGQQRLFDPKYLKALDSVRKGEYGPVVNVRNYWFRNADWRREVPSPEYERLINWRLYREYSRGLMTELACHQLQNGIFATGELPCKVMGSGNIIYWKDGREVYDNVSVIYTFPSGVNMTFESVISNKHFGMGEQILCKEGTVDLPNGRYFPEVPPKKTAIRQLLGEIEKGVFSNPAFAGTSWAPETAEDTSGISIMPEASGDGSLEMMQAFCDACISGVQPEGVLREAYYGSILSILGDEALLQRKILEFPEKYRVD